MKVCINCKHFKEHNLCGHPANGTDLVYGGSRYVFATLSRAHNHADTCGVGGKWYEEKPTQPVLVGFWARIWGKK